MDSMRAEIEQLRADISQAYDLRDKAEGRYCTALGAIERLTRERDEYKVWWERDSTALGKALNEVSSLRAVREESRAAIDQLHAAVKTAQELAARRLMEIEKLRKALKVAQQSLIEFRHAQECGPSWYTRGANGMYQQVSLWLRRGLEAVKDALGPYDDNGQYLKEMPAHEPGACPRCAASDARTQALEQLPRADRSLPNDDPQGASRDASSDDRVSIECPECFGDKRISMSDGSSRRCEYCDGTGCAILKSK